jgi:hypothetical protein
MLIVKRLARYWAAWPALPKPNSTFGAGAFERSVRQNDDKTEFTQVRCGLVEPEPRGELANNWPLPYNQDFA